MSSENIDFTDKILIWCRDNSKYLFIGAILGISIPLFWNYYQHIEKEKNLMASDLYSELVNSINIDEEYIDIEKEISEEYENTIYEVLSNFILSKQEFEKSNYSKAKKYLEDIVNTNINQTYNSLAKIKISLINIQEKKYDDALINLDEVELKDAFKHVLFELKGDIYKFKGDREKSLNFYDKAINASAIDNENLIMKKNSVKN